MGLLGFGLSALVIGWYSRKKELCPVWYAAMMIVMFSLNKWEMLYNGTGWAHFLAFGLFFWNYALLDQVYERDSETRRNRSSYFSLYCRL